MAKYDRSLEPQDQPQTQRKPEDHEHIFYGPDPVAMKAEIRDQPRPETRGLWGRIWHALLGS